jgi:hypothetical protein
MSIPLGELARLRLAVEEQAPVRAHQAKKWTGTLAYIAQRIAELGDKSDEAHHALFWIRLQQVLAELLPYCEESRSVHEQFGLHERAKLFAVVVDRCRDLAGLFSEDELMWMQYRRDTEGHIWQESYEIGVKELAKGSKIKESRRYEVIDKVVNVEDAMTRMRVLLRKYGNTIDAMETGIAVDFAKRCVAATPSLWEALVPFDKLALNIAGKV